MMNDVNIRPTSLAEYAGQQHIKARLGTMLEAAKLRNDALGHILITGGAGLGKTTLAQAIANERGVPFHAITATNVKSTKDVLKVIFAMPVNGILFIDEIHALDPKTEETLLTILEDFSYATVTEFRGVSQAVTVRLNRFTVIGATTRPDLLAKPTRDRFINQFRLQELDVETLAGIAIRTAQKLGYVLGEAAALKMALRARGTPRILNTLVKQARDYAQLYFGNVIKSENLDVIFNDLGIDHAGLNETDHVVLRTLAARNNAMGLGTLAMAVNESRETIETLVEPYLVAKGYVERTTKGRTITEKGRQHLQSLA